MKNRRSQNIKWTVVLTIVGFLFLSLVSCASPEGSNRVTPSETPAKTVFPLKTNTPQATPEPTLTPVILTAESTSAPTSSIIYESTSPDSRWTATTKLKTIDGEERSILEVSNDNGKVKWEVENEPFIDKPPEGFWFPVPFHWSKDGRYLYFSHRASGDGCFSGNNHSGRNLQRLDLATGEMEDVSPGGTYLAISPDDHYLAIVPYAIEGINVQNLENGDLKVLDLVVQQEEVGFEMDQRYITWSPDSRSLVFTVMAGVCDGMVESYFNWIVRAELQPLSQRFLTEKDEQGLIPISWVEPDKILVRDKDQNLWWMDANTGAISSVK